MTARALSLPLFLAAALLCAQANAQAVGVDDDFEDAAEADGDAPRRQLIHWNEYEGPYFSARLGGGLLLELQRYANAVGWCAGGCVA